MTDTNWYETLSGHHKNPVFTIEDFENCKREVLKDLRHYEKYFQKGSKILDVGCGLGSKAVPLSSLGYKVIGIDRDAKIVQVAKQNAKNFGGEIKIMEGDILKLNKIFDTNSFDVCICSGILEHFSKEDAKKLIDLQLELAPLLVASMPVKTKEIESDTSHNAHDGGTHGNFLSVDEWINGILNNYNVDVVEHFVESRGHGLRNMYLAYFFIKRKN